MPKLYEYFGLIILFYSREPIPIHCKYQGKQNKAEIIYENGKFLEVIIKNVAGKEPLDSKNIKKFKRLVEAYRDDIIRKWVDFFVYNKKLLLNK